MALADYFAKNHVAASQIVAGYDADGFTEQVMRARVGISFGPDAAQTRDGRLLLEMAVRLMARFYPRLSVRESHRSSVQESLCQLARNINPAIEIIDDPSVEIAIGLQGEPVATTVIYAGCDGWNGAVGMAQPKGIGATDNPIGAGISACLACAALFRLLFLGDAMLSRDETLSGYNRTSEISEGPALSDASLPDRTTLVGCGAIGNGAVWALANSPARGSIYLVDPEDIELSNLQRYVLTQRSDENRVKVELAASYFTRNITAIPRKLSWAEFVARHGYEWDCALVALDNAADRVAVQTTLPRWIVNGWTQVGDLGISTHSFVGSGACLACLYLARGRVPNRDEIVARALHIPEKTQEVRALLAQGLPAPRPLLDLISERLGVDADIVNAFASLPIQKLYSDGLCGGALLRSGATLADRDMHVPIAHQSTLAGVLLAATVLARSFANTADTMVTRIDVTTSLGQFITQPALKDPTTRCICQDADYISRYAAKYKLP